MRGEGKNVNEQFINAIKDFLKDSVAGEFKPHWYYNEAGDQIEVRWKNTPERGEYINDDIDLYHDIVTDEIVGVCIKNIRLKLEYEYNEKVFEYLHNLPKPPDLPIPEDDNL